MRHLLLALMLGIAGAAWAAPAVQVEQVDGKVLVTAVASKIVAWRPAEDMLVVLVPQDSGTVDVGTGVDAEKVADGGLAGLVVKGTNSSWQVVQDGGKWLLRPGSGLKSDSVLMLRDGWRVAGATVKPQSVNLLGKTWQVALVDKPQSLAGSVVGGVKLGTAAPYVAQAPKEDPVAKVAEGVPPTEKVVEKASGAEVPAQPKPVVQALTPVRTVPLRVATVEPATVQGNLRTVSLSDMLARIEPAAGDEHAAVRPLPLHSGLEAPKGMAAVAAASVTVTVSSGLAKVAIHPAPSMKPLGVGGVDSEILPQVLGDIYIPGTLVSLTLPDVNPDVPHGGVNAGRKVSAVELPKEVSGSWNQTVLDPLAQAMAEAKAAKEATPTQAVAQETVAHGEPDIAPVPEAEPAKGVAMAVGKILPPRNGAYTDDLSDALLTIADAPENSSRARDGQLNLAAVYLAWQRPEEALAVLQGLPERDDGLPANPQARLYMGMAQLAKGEAAKAALFDQGGVLAAHGRLWKAVAASKAGDFATALKIWPQERGILPQYPAYLREMAQLAQATALVLVGDRKVAMKVVDQLAEGYDRVEDVPAALVRLRGLVRLGTPEESKGLEYLAAAAADMRDPATAYRAKFDFVRALQQRHDLSDAQVKTYLTELWFDWRGDDLERDVLGQLADLHDQAGESRQALQYWQTLVKAYPKAPEMGRITEKMTNAFLHVFDPENPRIYDALAYIGLYYDFSELVPNDARGDVVQEQVAKLLVDANLWGRAVPILEQQLQYRPLDTNAQARLSLLLAQAYAKLGRAGDGVKIIDKWQQAAQGNSELAKQWKLVEADLLLQLKRPDAVSKALVALPDKDTDILGRKVEARWMAQDWSSTVPLLQKQLANVTAAQLVSDTGAQLAALRLGYAYGQLRDGSDLDALARRYAPGLAKLPQLSDDIGAVAAGTGVSASVVASGPLAPLTGALNDINRLTERVHKVRLDMAEQRKEQQEYNDKMRYMELLPPPAI